MKIQSFNEDHAVTSAQYILQTKPNRNYTVRVRAVNCAGPGPEVVANGTCITERAAPESVSSPKIFDQNSLTIRRMEVILPVEWNGPISCVFVIAKAGLIAFNYSEFTLDQLKMLESASDIKPAKNVAYLALAIPRHNFSENQYLANLGDNSLSLCELQEEESSARKKRNTEENLKIIRGKNWPLRDEETYSYYSVTSTPVDNGKILFQRSQAASFKNTKVTSTPNTGSDSGLAWLAGLITGIFLLGALAGIFYFSWIRKTKYKIDQTDLPMKPVNQEAPAEEPCYSNVGQAISEQIPKTCIRMVQLQRMYIALMADKKMGMQAQFKELKLEAKLLISSTEVACKTTLAKKNRYKNILPYDKSRVVLSGEEEDSYINACYIDGHERKKKFIATQGPLPNTEQDFWRMVEEQKCKVIVMLAKCIEAGRVKCKDYWPDLDQDRRFEAMIVSNEEEQVSGDFIRRKLKITGQSEEIQEVIQYQFLRWPDHGVPDSTSGFFRLHKAVMKHQADDVCPIIVHCSAGAGRTGTFMGFDILLKKSQEQGYFDAYNSVLTMRKQRVEMVQNSEQYALLHQLLLEFYVFGETDIDLGETDQNKLADQLNELELKSKIKKEFENLKLVSLINSAKGDDEDDLSSLISNDLQEHQESTEMIYTNATELETSDDCFRMIAAKGPSPSNLECFLNAIIDSKVTVIVMLDETDKEKVMQYWPSSGEKKREVGTVDVVLKEENSSGSVTERKLILNRGESTSVNLYQYVGWSPTLAPEEYAQVLDLVGKLKENTTPDKCAVALVHCSDGIGRTGAFCALVNLIDRLESEKRVDVFRTVKDLRDCRPGMVQTLDQYRFCYKCVQAYLAAKKGFSVTKVKGNAIYENI